MLPFLLFFSCDKLKTSDRGEDFVFISPNEPLASIVARAAQVRPSPQQLAWQEMETNAFIHFGINTFMDREWGEGTEDPQIFNPTSFDADQWAQVLKRAGMKMVILTAKHHDGFCLWQSKFTDYSVKNSPWKNGRGDIVREVAEACKKFGLKFGLYVSPWDRHEPTYGDSPKYNEFFKNQLRELLTNYGEISEVWFDGACGEGINGKKQIYDWKGYYQLIRQLQPDALIAIMGPDIRWIGTETGMGRETEWSVIPMHLDSALSIPRKISRSWFDSVFLPRDRTEDDLGSRKQLKNAQILFWYPAEANVSIRPGWFYHARDDDKVKTAEQLMEIYLNSVGKNAVMLLNVPPDPRGLIHKNDVAALLKWKALRDSTFSKNLFARAKVRTSSENRNHKVKNVLDAKSKTYWTTEDGVKRAVIELTLERPALFDLIQLQEAIIMGQRVEKFHIEVWQYKEWVTLTKATTIGYKKILHFPPAHTKSIRIVIDESRAEPAIAEIGVYRLANITNP